MLTPADPAEPIGAETAPNGGRVNIGAYGATPEASKSPTRRIASLLSPMGGEYWSGRQTVRWKTSGQGWDSRDTIRLEYSSDGGTTWHGIAGAAALDHAVDRFDWDTETITSGPRCRVRVICNQDASAQSQSARDFTVQNSALTVHDAALTYYVNDISTDNDKYCNALGDDVNDGLTPATPKATLQAVISAYDLEAGDTVYVDAGTYQLSSSVVIPVTDGGDATADVRLQGVAGLTILDRGSTPSGAGLEIHGNCVCVDGFTFRGFNVGISVNLDTCETATITHNIICGNTGVGLEIKSYWYGSGDHYLIQNNLLVASATGMNLGGQTSIYEVINNTVVSLGTGIVCWGKERGSQFRNNIVWARGAGNFCLAGRNSIQTSDYNNLLATSGAFIAQGIDFGFTVDYPSLLDWQNRAGFDAHSLSVDPLFADAGGEDYHLRSTGGHWNPATQSFVTDTSSSLCIDAGAPYDSFAQEASPNGARINMGADGGTAQASRTPIGPSPCDSSAQRRRSVEGH